jgi:NADPH:quinone reductase-like Zn-dependent oxidoreductase
LGLIKLPDGIPLIQPRSHQALTAYHMLYTVYGLRRGDVVLVNAIGGGVGPPAPRLQPMPARAAPSARRAKARWRTAPKVVLTKTDFEAVLDLTGGKVDLAIDPTAPPCSTAISAVRKLGHVISIGERGPALQEHPRAHPAALASSACIQPCDWPANGRRYRSRWAVSSRAGWKVPSRARSHSPRRRDASPARGPARRGQAAA